MNTPSETVALAPSATRGLHRRQVGQLLFLAALGASLWGAFRILQPFLDPLVLGALLASVCHPLHRFLARRLPRRPNLTALLACVVVALVVIVPVGALGTSLALRGVDALQSTQQWLEEGNLERLRRERLDPFLASATGKRLVELQQRLWPETATPGQPGKPLHQRLLELSQKPLGFLANQVLPLLGNALGLLVHFVTMLFAMFFFFRDGEQILAYGRRLSPFSDEHEALLFTQIKATARSAILGNLLTAAAQAVLAMVGFGIVGIPWLFWGTMLGFASLVPIVGTALVWVPAVLYLLAVGKVGMAIFLALWCMLVVGLADNFLRPYLMQGGTGMSSFILFFALLGGIAQFGLMGLIYGPLIFALAAVLIYIYTLDNGPGSTDEVPGGSRAPPPSSSRAAPAAPPATVAPAGGCDSAGGGA